MKLDDFTVFRKDKKDIANCKTLMKYMMSYIMDDEHIYRIDIAADTLIVECTDMKLSLTKKSGEKTHPCNNGKCLNSDELRCIAIADKIHDLALNELFRNELMVILKKKNPDLKGYEPPDLLEAET